MFLRKSTVLWQAGEVWQLQEKEPLCHIGITTILIMTMTFPTILIWDESSHIKSPPLMWQKSVAGFTKYIIPPIIAIVIVLVRELGIFHTDLDHHHPHLHLVNLRPCLRLIARAALGEVQADAGGLGLKEPDHGDDDKHDDHDEKYGDRDF